MNILAIGYDFKKKQYDIINRISENVLYIPIQVVDLKSFQPIFNAADKVIIFGAKAKKFFDKNNQGCLYHLNLPVIQDFEEDENNKEKVWKALLKFKETLDNCLTITKEDLPNLKSNEVLSLEAQLKKKNISEWFGKTSNGKTVCLSFAAEENKADINLSFAELYTLKIAMEILDIEEIIINNSK